MKNSNIGEEQPVQGRSTVTGELNIQTMSRKNKKKAGAFRAEVKKEEEEEQKEEERDTCNAEIPD